MAESKSAALPLGYTPSLGTLALLMVTQTGSGIIARRAMPLVRACGDGYLVRVATIRRAPTYRAAQYESDRWLTITPWLELACTNWPLPR